MYRERYRQGAAYSTGTITYGDGGTAHPTYDNQDYCKDDSTGSYSIFECVKNEVSGSRITGYEDAWDGRTYFDYPSTLYDRVEYWIDTPSDLDLATSALSHSNPNKSDMSLPNSLIELRELPSLVRSSGEIAIDIIKKQVSRRTIASANLSLQFGILPMVSDALTLARAASAVNRRLQNMQNLNKHGSINKKKMLGIYKESGSWLNFFETNRTYLAGDTNYDVTAEVWGISKWALNPASTSSPLYSNHSDYATNMINEMTNGRYGVERINAFRHSIGLMSYTLSDLWNILPWSWLVDYFANLGEVIDANDNSLGLEPIALAICRKYTAVKSHPEIVSASGNSRCTAGNVRVVAKTRVPVSISSAQQNIHLKKAILSPNQMGILASLAVSFTSKRNGQFHNKYINWANNIVSSIKRI